MTSANSDLTRRKFMLLSAAAVAAPLLTDLLCLVPEAKAAEQAKTVKKGNIDFIDPKCNGCQVCTIMFSNCLALNNRLCWCEPARKEDGGEDRA